MKDRRFVVIFDFYKTFCSRCYVQFRRKSDFKENLKKKLSERK